MFEILEEYLNQKSESKDLQGTTITDVHHCDYEELKINKSEEHSRVFVKIQDGCDRYCTYCIIPYVRGNLRSRKPEDVVREIEEIAANGYREVVITGIHLSSYGKDFLKDGKPSLDYTGNADYLIDLLKDINKIEGIDRIRIGSFEPMILSEDFVAKLSKINKLCPHFHISLQSGCDSVLKRMNRHYDTKQFYEKTVLLREYFPGCALTTDVIVGFPGETEEEFEETYKYLTKIKFFETHIFPYSRRKGTVADRMPAQLTMNEKKERVSKLLELDAKLSREYRESKLGDTDNIIVEEIKTVNGENYYVGHTPEYVMVALKEDEALNKDIGRTVKVKLVKMLTDEVVLGEKI